MPAPLLIDSNVLLRFSDPSREDGKIASAAVDRLNALLTPLYYCSQNIGEFWNTLTRPLDHNGFGLTPREAYARVQEVEAKFEFLPDGIAVHRQWLKLLSRYQVSGIKVHDAHLVAVMVVHGVRHILTFNTADFARYSEIEAVHPRDAAVR